jgi:hypothetical protein
VNAVEGSAPTAEWGMGQFKPNQDPIYGSVRNEDGQPLAGVLLRLTKSKDLWTWSASSAVGKATTGPRRLEIKLEEARRKFLSTTALPQETTTDANGDYRFENLPDCTWKIEGFKPNHLFSRQASFRPIENGTRIDLIGSVLIQVPVEVLGIDRRPLDSPIVECANALSKFERVSFQWSSGKRHVQLSPGEYEFTAYGPILRSLL